MSGKVDPELERFLREVDEITDLVEGIRSDDPAIRDKAFQKADEKLVKHSEESEVVEGCRVKINRTLINKNPSTDAPPQNPNLPGKYEMQGNREMSQENFLSILERDAEERGKRRKEGQRLASALKEKGNAAFEKEDYVAAVQYYTEGLEKLRDFQALYTNRAQAYIKLGKYEDAISDCEWALKCNENCVKAYVHMGKANLGLKKYEEARQCYQKIITIDPNREKLAKEYINLLELAQKKEQQEKRVMEEFERGNVNTATAHEVLKKLSSPNKIPFFYLGGVRFLTELMKECTEQTLFRTNGGFGVINDNEVIRRSLVSSEKELCEVELCVSVLALWKAVCHENEENQRMLITSSDTSELLLSLLSCKESEIYKECLALLSIFLLTEYGRGLLLCNLNLTRLMKILIGFVNYSDETSDTAMKILTNLIPEKKFRKHCQNDFAIHVIPSFEILLKNLKLANKQILPQCISIIGSLASDKTTSGQIAGREEFWESCLICIDEAMISITMAEYRDVLYTLLGLMVNLSIEQCTAIQIKTPAITERCISLLASVDGGILTRAAGLLSHVLPQSDEAVAGAVKAGMVKKMLKFIKAGGKITTRYAAKILAICSSRSEEARGEIVRSDKKFNALRKLLSLDDDQVVGNAALCLSHCFEIPGAAASLLKTDIVRMLLKHAGGDAKENSLQQNAAIALGKLCLAEPRHKTELRELHGLEILMSCMKYIK
ncbi:tetratricopeptide repeat protein 12 [Pristis pectinata]|uniref:tetratricopeptide repeat protein 12 n=1 Tax=Pristis pectinata TaxID=685728 RepID=UPI00223E5692|nr:tetratricopeptide repeat protein 12 [Pristis pectinata]